MKFDSRRSPVYATHGMVASTQPLASEAGLRRGDVIQEVNQAPVDSVHKFRGLVAEAESGKAILLLVVRGEGTFFTTLKKP